jgi:Transposase IS66 family
MQKDDEQETLNNLNGLIDAIVDEQAKAVIQILLNQIERLVGKVQTLQTENQKLRNEINQLKGEKGKPNIRPQGPGPNNKDISSEKERKSRNKKKKKPKNKKNRIVVNRTVKCEIDLSELPVDVIFKGYQTCVVQDIVIQTDNIEFKKEVYYSPLLQKTFIASLPTGYHGEFGPNLKALILSLHSDSKMTEPAIVNFLTTHGILISGATVSRVITDVETFHQEKQDIVSAGLPSTIYQQMDDTGARVNGKNYYTHILCNELYAAYFTRPRKDRLMVLEILSGQPLTFCFNDLSYALMQEMQLPKKVLEQLKHQNIEEILTRPVIDALLKELFPNPKKHHKNRRIILEATAIVAYQQLPHAVKLLLTDDAPQFKRITEGLALCWIHDGRHYKKLSPVFSKHQKLLDHFLTQYWDFYHQLLAYKESPSPVVANQLRDEFHALFSTKTGYEQLDCCIANTLCKVDSLLLVLQYPELPLHNNTSELAARVQARYRDISLHTQNQKGTEAKDTLMTIVSTAKKLGVNAFQYIKDRVSKKFEMPALADLVAAHNTS